MTAVLVDSNVILDIATADQKWGDWSRTALSSAAERYELVINPLIYAEVSVAYARIEDVDVAVPRDLYKRENLPYAAGFLAGKAFVRYRRRGGKRSSPLPDFYIGAHAAIVGHHLLTRDPSRFRNYFPSVLLISPKK